MVCLRVVKIRYLISGLVAAREEERATLRSPTRPGFIVSTSTDGLVPHELDFYIRSLYQIFEIGGLKARSKNARLHGTSSCDNVRVQ